MEKDNSPVIAFWTGRWLWTQTGFKGLALRANRRWSLVAEGIFWVPFISDNSFTKKEIVEADTQWIKALNKIEIHGLPPSRSYKGKTCSCGVWKLYGKDYLNHTSDCSHYDNYDRFLLPEGAPTNNDGRVLCLICGEATKTVSGRYQLCQNNQCRWHEN